MYETRQQRRNREAEARRTYYTGYTGPWVRGSDIVSKQQPGARVNRRRPT